MLEAKKTGKSYSSQVFYRKNEYSFDTEPRVNADLDLMVGDLFLSVDSETMSVKSVSGYNHFNGWEKKKLHKPSFFLGDLILTESIEPGVSKRIEGSQFWPTSFDEESGLICIGDDTFSTSDVAVEFLSNAIAVLHNGALKALWVGPKFE